MHIKQDLQQQGRQSHIQIHTAISMVESTDEINMDIILYKVLCMNPQWIHMDFIDINCIINLLIQKHDLPLLSSTTATATINFEQVTPRMVLLNQMQLIIQYVDEVIGDEINNATTYSDILVKIVLYIDSHLGISSCKHYCTYDYNTHQHHSNTPTQFTITMTIALTITITLILTITRTANIYTSDTTL